MLPNEASAAFVLWGGGSLLAGSGAVPELTAPPFYESDMKSDPV